MMMQICSCYIINIVKYVAHCGKEEEKEDSRERERDDFKNKNNIRILNKILKYYEKNNKI